MQGRMGLFGRFVFIHIQQLTGMLFPRNLYGQTDSSRGIVRQCHSMLMDVDKAKRNSIVIPSVIPFFVGIVISMSIIRKTRSVFDLLQTATYKIIIHFGSLIFLLFFIRIIIFRKQKNMINHAKWFASRLACCVCCDLCYR